MITDWLWNLAPRAHQSYREAFVDAETVLAQYGIDNVLREQHFIAQVLHESGALTILVENLSYSAERLVEVWPTRFPTLEIAAPYARNPFALANRVYSGRLGNTLPDDGWFFRGRGMLQITGRRNYQTVSDLVGEDFMANPDIVLFPQNALHAAAAMWQALRASQAADTDDIVAVTRRVNGGKIGIVDRTRWLQQVRSEVNV